MPATIKDIARATGVSVSTVSRILNGKSKQNKKLIALVKEKARELNYQVNTAAAGLRTNKTRMIGIVMPEINNDFFAEILSGVEEVVEQHGYNLLICQSHESVARELKIIASLNACNVEGILIASSIESHFGEDLANEFIAMGRKVVYFDRVPVNVRSPYVTVNDFEGIYQVTDHLLKQGRKRLMYIGFNEVLTNNNERLRGFQEVLKYNDIAPLSIVYDPSEEELLKIVEEHGIDAIVCYNDHIAAEILTFLKHGKILVPNDIAVTGFDNRHLCELLSPTLTSIDHSTTAMGITAAELLFRAINASDTIDNIVLPTKLVVRESSVSSINAPSE